MYLFPSDAISTSTIIVGATTNQFIAPTGTTILGIHMKQSAISSDTDVLCGKTVIGRNFAQDYGLNLLHYYCNSNLYVSKTGVDTSVISITYVQRDLSLRPDRVDQDVQLLVILGIVLVALGLLDFIRRFVQFNKR